MKGLAQKDKLILGLAAAAFTGIIVVYTVQSVYSHREYVRSNEKLREQLLDKMVQLHPAELGAALPETKTDADA